MVPGIGSSRPGDTNFGGDAGQGVAAESILELPKTALAAGECHGAAQIMRRGTEARFPPEKREEANRLKQEIARCFRGVARSKSYRVGTRSAVRQRVVSCPIFPVRHASV